MPLSQRDVVATALGILDSYGLGDLSMRRIADALGVRVGALYHHVANKQSLLAALSDEILRDLPRPEGSAGEVVTAWGHAFRAALLAHRDGAELVASVLAMRLGDASPVAHLADALAGVVERPRVVAATVVHLVLGHVMDEQGHAQLVELGVALPGTGVAPGPQDGSGEGEADFAASLDLVVRGVAAGRGAGARTPA